MNARSYFRWALGGVPALLVIGAWRLVQTLTLHPARLTKHESD